MMNPKDNKEFMQKLGDYLRINNFVLPQNAEFQYLIDGIDVLVDGKVVLAVGDRPPTVIYEIHETEHTQKYLQPQTAVAA